MKRIFQGILLILVVVSFSTFSFSRDVAAEESEAPAAAGESAVSTLPSAPEAPAPVSVASESAFPASAGPTGTPIVAPLNEPVSPQRNVNRPQYPDGPIQKAGRGLVNAALGWTEIPKRIIDITKQSNPIKGLILGILQGTCKAFARTVSGVADLVTFPIGNYDKPLILPDMPAVTR